MSARLADERGFTLVELLAPIVVSTIVLFALFGLVDTATRRQSAANDRIDANDRGRVAMDAISTQLRSRVCISGAEDSRVGTTAFFRSSAMRAAPPPRPELLLAPTPLSATDLTRVAQITVGFAAKGKVAGLSTPLQNRILDRSPGCYFG